MLSFRRVPRVLLNMNDESEIFEPSEAIELLAEHSERFKLVDERVFYFLFRTLGSLPQHLGLFSIREIEKGCAVTFFGKRCEYEVRLIEVKDRFTVAVLAQPFSDKRG